MGGLSGYIRLNASLPCSTFPFSVLSDGLAFSFSGRPVAFHRNWIGAVRWRLHHGGQSPGPISRLDAVANRSAGRFCLRSHSQFDDSHFSRGGSCFDPEGRSRPSKRDRLRPTATSRSRGSLWRRSLAFFFVPHNACSFQFYWKRNAQNPARPCALCGRGRLREGPPKGLCAKPR
jgi:hypothetical protein